MTAFAICFAFIFVAELGDKSMLLALAFATKYSWQTVLKGVFVATAINHLLVTLLGTYMIGVLPMEYISLMCAVAFIGFGLWTIRGDVLDEDDVKATKYTPFLTVAIAFFLSEMGDKTQLATLTLAVEHNSPLFVWLGTTLGMVAADGVGILLGKMLGNKIPEELIKWVAATIFIIFGFWEIYVSITDAAMKMPIMIGLLVVVAVIAYFIRRPKKDLPETNLENI